ncbi:MAG: hypothetical protein CMJ18_19460 [Phycisphaeraceae bacterium]|nr:hypothetical protein [Phycisphaeraceae bacterium]
MVVAGLVAASGSAEANFLRQFDFEGEQGGTHPGSPELGYTIVTPITPDYAPGQGYGFTDTSGANEVIARNHGGADLRLKDFMFIDGIEPVFRVDVPENGVYEFDSWAGDMSSARFLRLEVSGDGGSNWTLYGKDTNTNDPLPGTFMTTFADSASPGNFLQTIPNGKSSAGVNYRFEAREFLQVHDAVNVTSGHILFRIGSSDRMYNSIVITPEPSSMLLMAGIGAVAMIRRRR